jgi:hypothetical protein
MQFRLKEIFIQRSDLKTGDGKEMILQADNIDRVAIFSVSTRGFSVYIFIKGNPHEYIYKPIHGIYTVESLLFHFLSSRLMSNVSLWFFFNE